MPLKKIVVLEPNTRVDGKLRDPGYTTKMPAFAAKNAAMSGDIQIVNDESDLRNVEGSHFDQLETRDGGDLEDENGSRDEQATDSEAPSESEGEHTDEAKESVSALSVPFQTVKGIGESTVEAIREDLKERGIETVDELRDSDLKELPGLSDAKAERLGAFLDRRYSGDE
ncbi:MAG: helix-hairpin-helix domain-containing protein [Bradymonadaceae bacterium]